MYKYRETTAPMSVNQQGTKEQGHALSQKAKKLNLFFDILQSSITLSAPPGFSFEMQCTRDNEGKEY
jgi:hypothetical protein